MTRFGAGITEQVLRRLISEVVSTREPERMGLVSQLESRPLDQETRETLRELLADELLEAGLGIDGEPNPRGHLLEAAIDWLGHQ